MTVKKTNSLGLSKKDYVGQDSTLCTGCGHDSVTSNIITAFYNSGINPHSVAKLSGIGCSSKTPTYFMNQAHGFNSIHGRMAPVATGVHLANKNLKLIGVSGDGDTASIGLGGFCHLIRRNVPMIYIVENNGVYGLTKGQFSATADQESTLKTGEKNPFLSIDICSLAIDLGCGFVARSFSGDTKQLTPLIEAAIRHNGTAVIDVISPCITFANHDGSTKSYNYVKDHKQALQELGFIQSQEQITVDYDEGTTEIIKLPDGSQLTLKKIDSKNYDVHNSELALQTLHRSRQNGEILIGLLYYESKLKSLSENLNICDKPLHCIDDTCRPTPKDLEEILEIYS